MRGRANRGAGLLGIHPARAVVPRGVWSIEARESGAELVLARRGAEVARERLAVVVGGTLRLEGRDPAGWTVDLELEPGADGAPGIHLPRLRFVSRIPQLEEDGSCRFFGKLAAGAHVRMMTLTLRATRAPGERDRVEVRAIASLPTDDATAPWMAPLAHLPGVPGDAAVLQLRARAVRLSPPEDDVPKLIA